MHVRAPACWTTAHTHFGGGGCMPGARSPAPASESPCADSRPATCCMDCAPGVGRGACSALARNESKEGQNVAWWMALRARAWGAGMRGDLSERNAWERAPATLAFMHQHWSAILLIGSFDGKHAAAGRALPRCWQRCAAALYSGARRRRYIAAAAYIAPAAYIAGGIFAPAAYIAPAPPPTCQTRWCRRAGCRCSP